MECVCNARHFQNKLAKLIRCVNRVTLCKNTLQLQHTRPRTHLKLLGLQISYLEELFVAGLIISLTWNHSRKCSECSDMVIFWDFLTFICFTCFFITHSFTSPYSHLPILLPVSLKILILCQFSDFYPHPHLWYMCGLYFLCLFINIKFASRLGLL